jgi:diguanylate cyclase (GGDEF)-like protein
MSVSPRDPVRSVQRGVETPGSGVPVRVILVGRTGLDAALRLDEEIELIRVRTPLGAIGELADPIDAESPASATVVFAPDAAGAVERPAIASALRRVDPGVRVLLAGTEEPEGGDFDGAIDPEADAASVRRVVRGLEPLPTAMDDNLDPDPGVEPVDARTRELEADAMVAQMLGDGARTSSVRGGPVFAAPASFTPAAAPPPAPAPAAPAPAPAATAPPPPVQTMPGASRATASSTGGAPRRSEPVEPRASAAAPWSPASRAAGEEGDASVLAAVLAGKDPVPAALDAIRARRRVLDARFVPASDVNEETGGAPVAYAGRSLGRLLVPGIDPALVESEARWLGGWIVLATQQDQLRRAAFTDELTGAWNRRYFARFLGAALDQAAATRHPLTLLVFDIDDFKKYNDKYGHAAGDEILIETVRLLNSVIRPTDRVCRIGGDEFAVVFHDPEGPREPAKPGTAGGTPSSIATIAERFQRQICLHKFPKLADEAPGTLTISGGMATFPWDGRNGEELLARADQLAIQSKRQGKNVITLGPGAERVCRIGH